MDSTSHVHEIAAVWGACGGNRGAVLFRSISDEAAEVAEAEGVDEEAEEEAELEEAQAEAEALLMPKARRTERSMPASKFGLLQQPRHTRSAPSARHMTVIADRGRRGNGGGRPPFPSS